MRKHSVGGQLLPGTWSPRFKLAPPKPPPTDERRRKKTLAMSYFPSVKTRGMVPLRHYFHVDMAYLLDAWPEVVAWTTDAPPLAVARPCGDIAFTPDIIVTERDRAYALRLLDRGTKPSKARDERYRAIDAAYRERGGSLVVVTREELEAHPHLQAAKSLFYHHTRNWPADLPFTVVAATGTTSLAILDDLHRLLGGSEVAWADILSLVAHGYIRVDLDAGLQPQTPILALQVEGWRP